MKLLNQMDARSWTTDCRLELSSVVMIDQFDGKELDQLVFSRVKKYNNLDKHTV